MSIEVFGDLCTLIITQIIKSKQFRWLGSFAQDGQMVYVKSYFYLKEREVWLNKIKESYNSWVKKIKKQRKDRFQNSKYVQEQSLCSCQNKIK